MNDILIQSFDLFSSQFIPQLILHQPKNHVTDEFGNQPLQIFLFYYLIFVVSLGFLNLIFITFYTTVLILCFLTNRHLFKYARDAPPLIVSGIPKLKEFTQHTLKLISNFYQNKNFYVSGQVGSTRLHSFLILSVRHGKYFAQFVSDWVKLTRSVKILKRLKGFSSS